MLPGRFGPMERLRGSPDRGRPTGRQGPKSLGRPFAFYAPPADSDDPPAPVTGVTTWLFPEWFVGQDARRETTGIRSRPLVHRLDLDRGMKLRLESRDKSQRVVPVRLLQRLAAVAWGQLTRAVRGWGGQAHPAQPFTHSGCFERVFCADPVGDLHSGARHEAADRLDVRPLFPTLLCDGPLVGASHGGNLRRSGRQAVIRPRSHRQSALWPGGGRAPSNASYPRRSGIPACPGRGRATRPMTRRPWL